MLGAFAAVLVLGYAPVASGGLSVLGSLPRYLAEEYFNPGLLRSVVDCPGLEAAALAVWVLWMGLCRRAAPLPARALPVIGGALLLSPNLFPWYALWLVPVLAAVPSLPWIAFTGTLAMAYTFFLQDPWAIPWWARAVEAAPLAAGAGWWLYRRRLSTRSQALGMSGEALAISLRCRARCIWRPRAAATASRRASSPSGARAAGLG